MGPPPQGVRGLPECPAGRGPSSQALPFHNVRRPAAPTTVPPDPCRAQTGEWETRGQRRTWGRSRRGGTRGGGKAGAGLTVQLHHGAEHTLQLLVDVEHGEGVVVGVHDPHVQEAQSCRGAGSSHSTQAPPPLPGEEGEGQEGAVEEGPWVKGKSPPGRISLRCLGRGCGRTYLGPGSAPQSPPSGTPHPSGSSPQPWG